MAGAFVPPPPPGFTLEGSANITMSDGQPGVGKNEATTREQQANSAVGNRSLLRDLARAHGLNQSLNPSRFQARVMMAKQEMPSGWTDRDVAQYQILNGLQRAMAKPINQLNNPSGKPLSAQEFNTIPEQKNAMSYTPGPDISREANSYFIDRAGRQALDQIAFNQFSSRWRANHGSSYAKDARGRTAQQAWTDYQRTPAYKQTVLTPYTKLLANGGRAKPAAKPIAGGTLAHGEDGVLVWNPKGN